MPRRRRQRRVLLVLGLALVSAVYSGHGYSNARGNKDSLVAVDAQGDVEPDRIIPSQALSQAEPPAPELDPPPLPLQRPRSRQRQRQRVGAAAVAAASVAARKPGAALQQVEESQVQEALATEAQERQNGPSGVEPEEQKEDMCHQELEAINGVPFGEYRIRQAQGARFTDRLAFYADEACQQWESSMKLEVTRFPNSSNILANSWFALRIDASFFTITSGEKYLCGGEVGVSSRRQCLGKVTWPSRWVANPSQWIVEYFNLKGLTKLKNYAVESVMQQKSDAEPSTLQTNVEEATAEDEDRQEIATATSWIVQYLEQVKKKYDFVLVILEWAAIFAGLAFVLSCLHALCVLLTLPQADELRKLEGLDSNSIPQLMFNTLLQGSSFVLGVDGFSKLAILFTLGDAPGAIIDGIYFAGLALSVLGVLRMLQHVLSAQIYEVALKQGKCVPPASAIFAGKIMGQPVAIGMLDLLVVCALMLFSGFAVLGGSYSEASAEEQTTTFVAFWGYFTVVLQRVMNYVVRTTLQHEGYCRAKLKTLARKFSAEGESSNEDPDCTLLDHLEKHSKVEVTMSQFCQACREGKDPLNAIDQDGEDPANLPSSSGLSFRDLRWHPHYIYKKTGSKATICGAPLCFLLLFTAIVRSLCVRSVYIFAAPTLKSFVPSEGVLVPDFSPDVKDYTLVYAAHIESVAILNSGDDILAREKEFIFTGQASGPVKAHDPMVPVSLMDAEVKEYPYDLRATVRGGSAAIRQTSERSEYRVTMARAISVIATIKLSAGTWSRCFYMSHVKMSHIAVPDIGTSSLRVELSTFPHLESIPISLEAWRALSRSGDRTLTKRAVAVFEYMSDAASDTCKRACVAEPGCIMSDVRSRGCYYVMIDESHSSCDDVHGQAATALSGYTLADRQALLEVYNNTEGNMTFCREKPDFCHPDKAFDVASQNDRYFKPKEFHLEDATNNVVTFTVYLRSLGRLSPPKKLFSRYINFWQHGAPNPHPNDFLAVTEQGSKITIARDDDGAILFKLDRYKFDNDEGVFRVLLVAYVVDSEFMIEFPEDLQRWKAGDGRFDVDGACQTQKDNLQVQKLWACSGRARGMPQPEDEMRRSIIVELEPLFPDKSVIGKVAPRTNTASSSIAPKTFTVRFGTAESPVGWSINETCALRAPLRTEKDLLWSWQDPKSYLTVFDCTKIELTTRDGPQPPLDPMVIFSFALWNTRSETFQVALLDAFVVDHADLVQQQIDSNFQGIVPKQIVAEDSNSVLTWDLLFEYSVDLGPLLCLLGESRVPPRFFARGLELISSKRIAKEENLLGAIKRCKSMPTVPADTAVKSASQLDWLVARHSPIAIALSDGHPQTLDALVDWYGDNYPSISAFLTTDPSVDPRGWSYVELAILVREYDCIAGIKRLIEKVRKTCEGPFGASERCTNFEGRLRSLRLDKLPLASDSVTENIIIKSRDFATLVQWDRVAVGQPDLTSERLSDLYPIWAGMPALKELDMGNNGVDFCSEVASEAQASCSWTSEAERAVEVASFSRLKDARVYQSADEAKEACLAPGKAACKHVSCAADGSCRLHYVQSAEMVPSRGGIVYSPTKRCFQDRTFQFLMLLPTLVDLRMPKSKLCQRGLSEFISVLPSLPALRSLDVSDTMLGRASTESNLLIEFGNSLKSISSLNVSGNELGREHFIQLLTGKSLTTLSAIDIKMSYSQKGSFEELAKKLSAYLEMRVFEIASNDLREGIFELAPAFNKWPELEYLDLRNTGMTGAILDQLAAIWKPKKLKVLLLGGNDLDGSGIKAVHTLLAGNVGLEKLDLSRAKIDSEGCRYLRVKGFNETTVYRDLADLDLSDNSIKFEEVQQFFQQVGTSRISTLKAIGVGGNPNTIRELVSSLRMSFFLAPIQETMKVLEALNMDGYRIELDTLDAMFLRSKDKYSMKKLSLNGGLRTTKESMIRHFSFLRVLRMLEIVDVGNNNLSKQAVKELWLQAGSLPKLRELSIIGSRFHMEDWPHNESLFLNLEVLRGDFSYEDIRFFRNVLPRVWVQTILTTEGRSFKTMFDL